MILSLSLSFWLSLSLLTHLPNLRSVFFLYISFRRCIMAGVNGLKIIIDNKDVAAVTLWPSRDHRDSLTHKVWKLKDGSAGGLNYNWALHVGVDATGGNLVEIKTFEWIWLHFICVHVLLGHKVVGDAAHPLWWYLFLLLISGYINR